MSNTPRRRTTPTEHLYDGAVRSPDPRGGTPLSAIHEAQVVDEVESSALNLHHDQGVTIMIGWTNLEGLWLVDGANADRLGVGASVVMYATADGERLTLQDQLRLGSQALTELGWAGSAALGDALDPAAAYEVLWPMGPNCVAREDMPATSRAEFERALSRFVGGPPEVTVGTASCEHGDEERVEQHSSVRLGA